MSKNFIGHVIMGIIICLHCAEPGLCVCPQFEPGVQTGTIQSGLIDEASGIAASRNNDDVFWVNNDKGDSARIFALTSAGTHLGVYNLSPATNIDYEDIAIGPGPAPGVDYIYIGDTGDNGHKRTSITVYRVAEPVVDSGQSPVTVTLSGVDAFPMQYPDDVYDAETLIVDPITNDIFLVTRRRRGEKDSMVFRKAAPHTPGVMVTLELVATISADDDIKGGAISRNGEMVILRPHKDSDTQLDGLLWLRPQGSLVGDIFSNPPCLVPLITETQGEAITFDADDCGYYTVSEGENQPIYYYSRTEQCPEPEPTADFNGDGDIDLGDFARLAGYWFIAGCGEPNWCGGTNMTRDGSVDENDLMQFFGHWLIDPALMLHLKLNESSGDTAGDNSGYG